MKETVILIHGMGRSRASMWILEYRLREDGFSTLNFPYVPQLESLDGISSRLLRFIDGRVKTPRYHLVGHSLGNIIIRNGFKQEYPEGLGRIVMIAPPNQPPELARIAGRVPLYPWLTGDSGRKLADPEFYASLPIPSVPFGVIAGTRGQRLTFSEPNDGVITVASTRLDGMADWIELPHTHTFIMNARDTADCCVRFLRTGTFAGGNPEAGSGDSFG